MESNFIPVNPVPIITPVTPIPVVPLPPNAPLVFTPDKVAAIVEIAKETYPIIKSGQVTSTLISPKLLLLLLVIGGIIFIITRTQIDPCCEVCPEGFKAVPFPVCCEPINKPNPDVERTITPTTQFRWVESWIVHRIVRFYNLSGVVTAHSDVAYSYNLGVVALSSWSPQPNRFGFARRSTLCTTVSFPQILSYRINLNEPWVSRSLMSRTIRQRFNIPQASGTTLPENSVIELSTVDNRSFLSFQNNSTNTTLYRLFEPSVTSSQSSPDDVQHIIDRYLMWEIYTTTTNSPTATRTPIDRSNVRISRETTRFVDYCSQSSTICGPGLQRKRLTLRLNAGFNLRLNVFNSSPLTFNVGGRFDYEIDRCFPELSSMGWSPIDITNWGMRVDNTFVASIQDMLMNFGWNIRGAQSLEARVEDIP